jgi:hypothetical protein
MKGHEGVIEMRRAGKRPLMVFINDWPCDVDWFETGSHAAVCTDGDVIGLLDFRFVVGLQVSISSESEERAKALAESCKQYADVVAAHHHIPGAWPNRQNGWTAVWRRDTQREVCLG